MELSSITLYDDYPTSKVFEPTSDSMLVESSTSLAPMARTTISLSEVKLKAGVSRRMVKLDVPVLETVAVSGNSEGYVSAPQVAHNISATLAVFSNDNRATPEQIAHAVKLLVNFVLADTTAGTANAYAYAGNTGRRFLMSGIGGD